MAEGCWGGPGVVQALWQAALTPCVFQRIRATVNSQEQKRLLMDLDISMRTVDCPFTVTFYGALFREVRLPGGGAAFPLLHLPQVPGV